MKATENGQLAVVTGAGTGIGQAIARRLARSGYRCLLVGRRLTKLEETAELIAGDGRQTLKLAADVTTPAGRSEILKLVDHVEAPFTALVNNAGKGAPEPLFDPDIKTWRAEFALNFEAAALLSLEAMRRMAAADGGSIVNVASVYGIVATNTAYYGDSCPPNSPDGPVRGISYATSKAALRMLSKELAIAGARMGVRVNTVSPGMIEVDSLGLDSTVLTALAKATPMGRMGRPDEIAGAVDFLLSAEASFITGAELVIDGGWTVW